MFTLAEIQGVTSTNCQSSADATIMTRTNRERVIEVVRVFIDSPPRVPQRSRPHQVANSLRGDRRVAVFTGGTHNAKATHHLSLP